MAHCGSSRSTDRHTFHERGRRLLAKVQWLQVRDLAQDIRSRLRLKSSSASRAVCPRWAAFSYRWKTSWPASIAIQGAVWAGAKAFTVTSGPGFSLMMEHIGYAAHDRDALRLRRCAARRSLHRSADPSRSRRHDAGALRLARRLLHHRVGARVRPQECFDLTIKAFNLAERYRMPVMFMMDECVGHMTEKVVIPPADKIEIEPATPTTKKPGEFNLFEPNRGPGARDGARG